MLVMRAFSFSFLFGCYVSDARFFFVFLFVCYVSDARFVCFVTF